MLKRGTIAFMLSAAALAMPLAGCASGEVFYDPYRLDYHRWNLDEDRYYRQWEIETNRNHMNFQGRSSGDQQAYWSWRHNGSSTDHARQSSR